MAVKLVGTGRVYIEGSDEVRVADSPGGNYSAFETDGTLEFNGDATVWEDMRVAGSDVALGASAPDLEAVLAAGGLRCLAFNGATTSEQVFFEIQMSHAWDGSAIYPHVHWMPSTADAGDVVWQLEYTWTDADQAFPASNTITVTDAAAGTAWTHQLAAFEAITPTATQDGLSSMLICRLFRDPTDADDDYAQDAMLLEFDVHYRINTVGSREEYTK